MKYLVGELVAACQIIAKFEIEMQIYFILVRNTCILAHPANIQMGEQLNYSSAMISIRI